LFQICASLNTPLYLQAKAYLGNSHAKRQQLKNDEYLQAKLQEILKMSSKNLNYIRNISHIAPKIF